MLAISIEERLVYRGDFALGTLMRFLPIVTQVFLWTAVFSATARSDIAGYSRNDIVAYYLLTMLTRAFSSMPGLASGIARSIRDGSIKKFLIQPVDYVSFLLAARVAHKLVYYAVAVIPFAAVFFLCRSFFPPLPDAATITAFLLALVLCFLLGFFMEATLGMLGFWFLEVSSIVFGYMLVQYLLSGHMFPIDMLAGIPTGIPGTSLADLVGWLPFQYTAYFPAAVWLGKIEGAELARKLALEAAWVVVMIVACRFAWARGTRRYSGFGG
ncbi:MAG: ABC-2 family transporter protein [Planctomycetota bacterium]|nr:ABC-2 family transporter protein [Planctomycetota bacterium]MDA1200547.1 ABC-2 family transporter protein [Planctomycetota bacterium]